MAQTKSRRQRVDTSALHALKKSEKFLIPASARGGELRVHLVYPNSYWVAMSNLGFQAVFKIFSQQSAVSVERGFLPDNPYDAAVFAKPWRTFESSRLLSDCDVLGFSLSFETDYPHLLRILNNAKLLYRSAQERAEALEQTRFGPPLIIAGGTAVTLNPEPVAPFIDMLLIGEAEEFLPEFTQLAISLKKRGATRSETLHELGKLEGVYIPSQHAPIYSLDQQLLGYQGTLASEAPQNSDSKAVRPRRRFVKDLSKFPTYSAVLTPETEFRSMFLTETGRGCEMGCRFCVAGYIYRPVRKRSEQAISDTVKVGLENSDSIGFVGAAVSSHKSIAKLASAVAASGARASLSSLMSQKVTRMLAASLSESEYKTVALAPEAGSEILRAAAGKRIKDSQIVEAAVELAEAGIRGFKLYFMVGLPGEIESDIDAIAELSAAVRDAVIAASKNSGRAPWVVLSVNPFIPKACTPFQWEPMLEVEVLESKIRRLKDSVKRIANLEINHESPKESYFQALLSRGDRRMAELLWEAEQQADDWRWTLKQAYQRKIAGKSFIDHFVTRRFLFEEFMPWEVVDSGIQRSLLQRECLRAHETAGVRLREFGGSEAISRGECHA